MTSYPLFQITFILRRPRVANFTDIIKLQPRFLKQSLKTQENVKRIGNYLSNQIFICISHYNKSY